MKGKSVFTRSEANAIIELIKQKLKADSQTQKNIRDKIRARGFYASDFGIGGGYTEHDFLSVVKIIDSGSNNEGNPSSMVYNIKPPKPWVIDEMKEIKDESYILDLCDEVLHCKGRRQHRFDFLTGDSGTKLPVDIYYSSLNLVIEYREKQHTEEVKFFDRRHTVSGVGRGEQRKIYDQRRRDLLPKHGIKLIEFGYDEFEHNRSKRLIRNKKNDVEIIREKLKKFISN
ncbi:MAG: hypothetical protein WCM76_15160 [Bacteroidota bacterium]